MRRISPSQITALIIVSLVAIVGSYLLNQSRATTPAISLEPETGIIAGGARVVSDGSASVGNAVAFGKAAGRFGFSIHLMGQTDRDVYMQLAKAANAGTIRNDFTWTSVETQKGVFTWTNPDTIMKYSSQTGIRVLAILDYAPKWASSCPTDIDYTKCAPANMADFANYANKVTDRYRQGGAFWQANPTLPYTPLSGIELWNEPNNGGFWHNPDGAKYTALLKAAYPAIKKADPSVVVLAGATSPGTNVPGSRVHPVTFMQQLYAAGGKGYFDAYSHHPYNYVSGNTAEYMMSYKDTSAWSQMSETNPSLRSVMVANGDGAKQIWATELGATTRTNGVSESEQARLATMQIAKWKSFSWAGNYYWYDLRDDCADATNVECRFGAVRADNTLKPVYGALKAGFIE